MHDVLNLLHFFLEHPVMHELRYRLIVRIHLHVSVPGVVEEIKAAIFVPNVLNLLENLLVNPRLLLLVVVSLLMLQTILNQLF